MSEARKVTTDGHPPAPGHEDKGAPQPINQATGQHGAYWILSDEERAKGFVRPVRDTYVHRGIRPKYPTRPLTEEEATKHAGCSYVAYEEYPEGSPGRERGLVGRFWTERQLGSGCGAVTKMSRQIAETYAREPEFYGSTFCVRCGVHLGVEEFVWDGTDEAVGS